MTNRTSILLSALLYVAIGILAVVLICEYQIRNHPVPALFTVNDSYAADLNQYPAMPDNQFKRRSTFSRTLNSPAKSLDDVLAWGAAKSIELFTTNFQNYYTMYDSASNSFTDAGWSQLREQLISSGLFEAVVDKKLASTAILRRPPILIRQGVLNGRYTWQTQFEMMVNYESASQNVMVNYNVTLRIVRVPVKFGVNNSGMAIDSLVAKKIQ